MGVIVFDRVLDRHDVLVKMFIDVIHHCGQRGGLARTGGAGHQEHPSGPAAEALADLRQADVLESQELGGNQTKNDRWIFSLVEHGGSEPARRAELKTEISAALLLQFLLATLRGDGLHQGDGVIGFEHLGFQRSKPPVQPQGRRTTYRQVQIACTLLYAGLKEPVYLDRRHGCPSTVELFVNRKFLATLPQNQ